MAGSSASTFLHHNFLNMLLRGGSWDGTGFNSTVWSPTFTTFYVALFTNTPNIIQSGSTAGQLSGTGNEVASSGTGYVRVAIPRSSTAWTASGTTYSNSAEVTWPTAPTANWGTITYIALMAGNSSTSNVLYYAAITSKTISLGDGAPKISAGQLQIGLATC